MSHIHYCPSLLSAGRLIWQLVVRKNIIWNMLRISGAHLVENPSPENRGKLPEHKTEFISLVPREMVVRSAHFL